MPKKKEVVRRTKDLQEQVNLCPFCGSNVPWSEYASHLQAHSLERTAAPPAASAPAPVPAVTSTPPGAPPGMYAPPNPTAVPGGIPAPVPQPRNPFLSLRLLGELSQGKGQLENVPITGVRQGVSKFGPSFSVDLNIAGGAYTLTVKVNSAKHMKLWEKYRDQWVGKTIGLRYGNPALGEREHIAIV